MHSYSNICLNLLIIIVYTILSFNHFLQDNFKSLLHLYYSNANTYLVVFIMLMTVFVTIICILIYVVLLSSTSYTY
jgi:hypothetical protein